MFSGDGDHGRHVRLGRTIIEAGRIPSADQFSHTMAGEPFIPFEWLSEVAFAAADHWLGLAGVALLTSLLFAGTGLLTYRSSLILRLSRFGAMLAAFAALGLLSAHLLPRPHMFSTFFVALVFLLLLSWRGGAHRVLWVLPPLFVIWANIHGGFLAGLIVLGVFWVEAVGRRVLVSSDAAWKPITIAAIGSLLATILNPAGFEVILHSLGYVQSRFMVDNTHEYLSVDFHDLAGRIFLVYLLFAIGLVMTGRAGVRFIGGTLFLGWLAGGLYSRRNLDFFAVTAVPFVGMWAQAVIRGIVKDPDSVPVVRRLCRRIMDVGERYSEGDRKFGGMLGGAVLAAIILWVHLGSETARARYRFPADVFPVDAVAWLETTDIPESGPVFNHFMWGGYLLYEAWPRVPVFIDGQTDFYGEQVFREYVDVRYVRPGWDRILSDRGVTWALIPPAGPLAERLRSDSAWEEAWSDRTAAVLVRRP